MWKKRDSFNERATLQRIGETQSAFTDSDNFSYILIIGNVKKKTNL